MTSHPVTSVSTAAADRDLRGLQRAEAAAGDHEGCFAGCRRAPGEDVVNDEPKRCRVAGLEDLDFGVLVVESQDRAPPAGDAAEPTGDRFEYAPLDECSSVGRKSNAP